MANGWPYTETVKSLPVWHSRYVLRSAVELDTYRNLDGNDLTILPAGVFRGLGSLETM